MDFNISNHSTAPDNLHKRIFQGIVYNYLGNILSRIISVIVMVYVIKQLSVSDYGNFSLMHGTLFYFTIFTTVGLRSVLRRFVPELNALRKYRTLKNLVASAQLFVLAASGLAFVIIFALSEPISNLLKSPNFGPYFKIFGLTILAMIQIELLEATLRSLLLQKLINILRTSYLLLRSLLFIYVISARYGLMGIFVAELICSLILLVTYFIFYHRDTNILVYQNHLENATMPLFEGRLIRYSLLSFLHESGATIFDVSTDFYIISIFLGAAAVGIYSFATKGTELFFFFIPVVIGMDIIRPAIYSRYAKYQNQKELSNVFGTLSKLLIFCAFPIMIIVVVLGRQTIFLLFGQKYVEVYPILIIVMIFALINLFQFPLSLVMNALERVEYALYSRVFSIYNIIMDIVLVQRFGVLGVACATGTTILFANLFLYYMLNKHVKLLLEWKSFAKTAINTFIMGMCILLIRKYAQNLTMIILVALMGIAIYLSSSFINKAFTTKERSTINTILGKPLFQF